MPDHRSLLIQSSPCRDALRRRAMMYAQIRQFFAEKDVLEVETPIFSTSGNTDPSIISVMADFSYSTPVAALKQERWRYAQTSPEFPMKRLLAQGSGPIYQICKVFRKEESGRLHNPEFSMLEWYRPHMSYHALMDEIALLLKALEIADKTERISYKHIFHTYLSLDVLNASVDDLKACARDNNLSVIGFDDDFDAWSAMLLANLIEPHLGKQHPVFIYDYPVSQAALAHINDADNVAERFELYIGGVEIANGYQELTDSASYLERFEEDNEKRKSLGMAEVAIDRNLINDIASGFPDSSGVALGLDRLLMLMFASRHINDTLSFSFDDA